MGLEKAETLTGTGSRPDPLPKLLFRPTKFCSLFVSRVATCGALIHMEKSKMIRVRIQPDLHREFVALCEAMNVNGSAIVRQCIQAFVDRHKDSTQADLFRQPESNK